MITESVAFILGAAIGGLLVWIWIQLRASYTSVRGSLAAREKAKQEKAKQAQKAREEITKGRRALLRTSLFAITAILLLGIVVAAIFFMFTV